MATALLWICPQEQMSHVCKAADVPGVYGPNAEVLPATVAQHWYSAVSDHSLQLCTQCDEPGVDAAQHAAARSGVVPAHLCQ